MKLQKNNLRKGNVSQKTKVIFNISTIQAKNTMLIQKIATFEMNKAETQYSQIFLWKDQNSLEEVQQHSTN